MKQILYTFLLLFSGLVFGQNPSSIFVSGGVVEKESYGAALIYTYNSNNSHYEIGVAHYMFTKPINDIVTSEFSNTNFQLGYLHTLLRSRDNGISINFGLGVFIGVETIKEDPNQVLKSEGGTIGGAYGAGQIDFYVSDNFAFVLRGQQNYLFLEVNSGKTNPYAGFGLKFNF